eukprot:5508042-Pleurochrysis_carterae.AAC.1
MNGKYPCHKSPTRRVCKAAGYGDCDRETHQSPHHDKDVKIKFSVERPRNLLVIDINHVERMRQSCEGMAAHVG